MAAGVVTGDSNQVTIGGAQVLFDTVDVGYTDGDIECNRETTVKELEDGIPLQVVLQVPIREKWNIKIPMVQSSIANMSRASSNLLAYNSAGTEVTISSYQSFTFAAGFNSSPLQGFQVKDSTASSIPCTNLNTVVVKDSTGVTTYTVDDDYFVDAARGMIYRNPSGAISSLATVRVTWKYTNAAYDELRFGLNTAIQNKKVEFIHVSPVDGRVHHTCFWKCQGTGSLTLSHKKEDWLGFTADMVALPDVAGHPSNPTGFRRVVPAAGATAYLATITVT